MWLGTIFSILNFCAVKCKNIPKCMQAKFVRDEVCHLEYISLFDVRGLFLKSELKTFITWLTRIYGNFCHDASIQISWKYEKTKKCQALCKFFRPEIFNVGFTLYFYNNEPSKNKHFLILLSSLVRYSQEPRLKKFFEILWVLFERILVFYSDLPKSQDTFCKCHPHKISN